MLLNESWVDSDWPVWWMLVQCVGMRVDWQGHGWCELKLLVEGAWG